MRPRAVIFDLWETLIDWDREAAAAMVTAVSVRAPEFVNLWPRSQNRYTGPIRAALADAGVPASAIRAASANTSPAGRPATLQSSPTSCAMRNWR